MIHIDDTRCIRCGQCATVCPLHCFHVTDKAITVRHQEHCMHCGHCTAVCPTEALQLDGIAPGTLPSTAPWPDADHLSALIRGRRSIRVFKDDAVSRETLLQALETVRYAPTGKNLQNISWIVLNGKSTLRKVADRVADLFRGDSRLAGVVLSHDLGGDPIFRGAPCAVFACADGAYDLDVVNCSLAVATLDLVLPVLGLGASWAGYVMRAASMDAGVREAMGLSDGLIPMAGLMVGHPAVHYRRIPARKELNVRWINGETA